ncbi:MRP1-like protein [Mya arenaria]|uniref:MRP1-like protein n=1 Tax=Mya arenaria TaxID=6604 RepID=A0ABY7G9I6_MYAAR|nr:MRP1-like protein [Mya arenaria]
MDLENATSYIQTNGTGMVGLVNLSSTSSQSSGVIETMSSTTSPALDQLSSTISSVNSSGTNRTTLNPLTEMFSSSSSTLVNSSSAGTPATSTVSFNQGSISTLSSISNTLFTDSENLTSEIFSSVPDMLSSTGFEYTHDFTSISSMANGTMTANYLVQKDILNEFCLGEPFWDDNLINVDVPTFSTCFTDTALSLGACAYLWMLAPFFILYMYLDKKYTPLPVSRLNTAKANVCPDENASVLNRILFHWLSSVVVKCYRGKFIATEFWEQTSRLRFIIQMIENKGLTDEPMWKGYMYAVILFLILCLNSFLYQIGIHHMTTVGLRVKTALICLIYKKALTMNKSGIKATTVGEVVNLMSVDCQRIQDGFTFSFYAVLIVVILIIATAQLWDLMGVASLGGLAVVLVVLPTINFFLVMIYVLTSPYHSLNAEQAFTALAIVNIIRFPIALCPFLVNGAVQGYVSVGRIQEFLWTSDLNKDNVSIEQKSVNDGELIAVVGPVGSGKSSLISACLGEMEKLSGQVSLRGKIAYVPQEAWIQNMTLRDNILFGKRHQEKKYRKVLDSCALLPDLEILAGGDMTEIGEKGINISGGQKQRVSLARAVYNNADVYFLDDPLSAVDSHVGKHLFKKVIGNEGLLKHKLVSHDGPFAQFLLQYMLKEDEVDEEEDPEIRRLKESIRMKIDEVKSDGGMTSEDDVISASGRRIRRNTGRLSNAYTKGSSLQRQTSKTPLVLDTTRLTVDEVSEEGSIKATVLVTYMKAMGILTVIIVFITMSIFQGLNVFSNFWLTFWTEDELLKNISLSETPEFEEKYMYYLLMCCGVPVLLHGSHADGACFRYSPRLHVEEYSTLANVLL